MLTFALCAVTAPAEVSASRLPSCQVTEQRIEISKPEHGHTEQDTAMVEFAYLDVHSPAITGELIQSRQSQQLLRAANQGMAKWWGVPLSGGVLCLQTCCAISERRVKGRTFDEGGMFMRKFYKRVALSAIAEFWGATDKTLTATAVALFIIGLFNRKIAKQVAKTWDGISPWWSLVPIGSLVLYRLLRSNYEAFASAERSKGTEISNLQTVVERVTWSPNRPQITFSRWDQIPASNPVAIPMSPTVAGQFVQRGFYLDNDGDAAHEVTVEPFQIEDLWWGSAMVPRIERHGQGFALVWLEMKKRA